MGQWSYEAGHAQDLAAKIESVIMMNGREPPFWQMLENVSLNYESHSAFLRLRELIESQSMGHYAAKQLFGKSQLINWSHRGRFMTGCPSPISDPRLRLWRRNVY